MRLHFWRRLVNDRSLREAWEGTLAWFRVRYLDRDNLERCLTLLSSAQACGRVSLYFAPGQMLSRLYVGVPAEKRDLLRRISADLNVAVAVVHDRPPAPVTLMRPEGQLPWDRPFCAQIVAGHLFVDELAAEKSMAQGRYLPPAPKVRETPAQHYLLQPPPVGLTTNLSLNGHGAPIEPPSTPDVSCNWPLGRSPDGRLLTVGGRLNVYGSGRTVAAWLANALEQLLRDEPQGLVIIDGQGDLAPALKRKSVVTRLLGKQLRYVDMDSAIVNGGFNPLAPVPDESDAALLSRWQRWFSAMGVHEVGLQLLHRARDAGVEDIVSLQRWAQRPAQQHFAAGISSLKAALRRLQADGVLYEWLSWPTNIYDHLPAGALLLRCRSAAWGRQQMLHGTLLAAQSISGIRLVLLGFPWSMADNGLQAWNVPSETVVANGPLYRGSTLLLTGCNAAAAALLAARFLNSDPLVEENLQLLDDGEAVLVREGRPLLVRWN